MHDNCEVCNDEQLQEALDDEGKDVIEWSEGTHYAMCRACHKMGNCSNDDGYCGDCN